MLNNYRSFYLCSTKKCVSDERADQKTTGNYSPAKRTVN
jgi:hypothetical protein